MGYTGELMGHDGTVYLRARHYMPTMGRFLQQDGFAGIPTSPQSLHKYSYAHNSPAWHTDPSGNFIPLLVGAAWLVGAWGVVETGIAIYDTYTTVDTLLDPCVSGWEKVATGALWIAGIFLPGGGYASGGKAVVRQLDHVDEVADALYHVDEFIDASDELAAAGKALDNTTGALDDAADVAHSVEQVDDADALLQVADDLPCVPGNSFVAGTLVESSQGLVPIETLMVGDTVWAIDPQTNQAGYYPITWTTAHTATLVIALTVQPLTDTLGLAQEQIQATDHHPFWVYGRGWIDAGKLRVGDRLLGDAGYTITVVDVGVELQPVMVYNFTVATLHTYTIGHAGILVHNTGCLNHLFGELDNYADEIIKSGALNRLEPGKSKTIAIFKSRTSGDTFRAISGESPYKMPEDLRKSLSHNPNNTTQPLTHRRQWNCAEMNCIKEILSKSNVKDTTPIRKIRPILQDFEFTIMNIERTPTGFLKQRIDPCSESGYVGCLNVLDEGKLNMLKNLLEW